MIDFTSSHQKQHYSTIVVSKVTFKLMFWGTRNSLLFLLHFLEAVYDNKVYIPDPTNPEFYDPKNNTWNTWPAPGYALFGEACLVAFRDSFLLIDYFLIHKFNLTTNLWTAISFPGYDLLLSTGCILLPTEEVLLAGESKCLVGLVFKGHRSKSHL